MAIRSGFSWAILLTWNFTNLLGKVGPNLTLAVLWIYQVLCLRSLCLSQMLLTLFNDNLLLSIPSCWRLIVLIISFANTNSGCLIMIIQALTETFWYSRQILVIGVLEWAVLSLDFGNVCRLAFKEEFVLIGKLCLLLPSSLVFGNAEASRFRDYWIQDSSWYFDFK